MKVSAVLAVVCAAVAYANIEYAEYADAEELDISKLLSGLDPILKTAKCSLVCLGKGANQIKPKGQGLTDAACENIDKIADNSKPCLKKCKVTPQQIKQGVDLAKKVCSKRNE